MKQSGCFVSDSTDEADPGKDFLSLLHEPIAKRERYLISISIEVNDVKCKWGGQVPSD